MVTHDTESALRASQHHRIPEGYLPRDQASGTPACPPCSQNCNQGRSCPTPTACEVPWITDCEREESDWREAAKDVAFVIFVVACAAVAAAVIF